MKNLSLALCFVFLVSCGASKTEVPIACSEDVDCGVNLFCTESGFCGNCDSNRPCETDLVCSVYQCKVPGVDGACLDDDNCTNNKPICNTLLNRCGECFFDSSESNKKTCANNKVCTNDDFCVNSSSAKSNGGNKTCSTNADCLSMQVQKICNTNINLCVECFYEGIAPDNLCPSGKVCSNNDVCINETTNWIIIGELCNPSNYPGFYGCKYNKNSSLSYVCSCTDTWADPNKRMAISHLHFCNREDGQAYANHNYGCLRGRHCAPQHADGLYKCGYNQCLTDEDCAGGRCTTNTTPKLCRECFNDSDCKDPLKPYCASNNTCKLSDGNYPSLTTLCTSEKYNECKYASMKNAPQITDNYLCKCINNKWLIPVSQKCNSTYTVNVCEDSSTCLNGLCRIP